MNAKQALAFCTLAIVGTAALADDPTIVKDSFTSNRSRAEVKSEVVRAGMDGKLLGGGELLTMRAPMVVQRSALSRDEVSAQGRTAAQKRQFEGS